MLSIRKLLKETEDIQRYFVLVFIIYYLFRLEPYTWSFSSKLLFWPSSFVHVDPVVVNKYFPYLLILWLLNGLIFIIRPQKIYGWSFLALSYLFVGRLNSYVFIQRFDFYPMLFLLLILLLPDEKTKESVTIKKGILIVGKIVWVTLFFSGGIEKLKLNGFGWTSPDILRNFIFAENILQGDMICSSTFRVSFINFLMQSNFLLSFFSMLVLCLELTYPLALFSRRLALVMLSGTLIFQVAVDYVLVTPYYSYWLGIIFWILKAETSDEQSTVP